MTTLREIAGYSWEGMSPRQKAVIVVIPLVLFGFLVAGWVRSGQLWYAVRGYERDATVAKREAEDALKLAAKIAKEKLEVERKLVVVEAKRDEKAKQAAAAAIKTIDARTDYERALREQRGDNPSAEQLCLELAAVGYPCS